MSGAGKSRVVNALEDLGYFCVDNLPIPLFDKFIEVMRMAENNLKNISIVADIRSADTLPRLNEALQALHASGYSYQVLFLDAADSTLVNRYKETRRRHPLEKVGNDILSSIQRERELLAEARGCADIIIDTTEWSPRQLDAHIKDLFSSQQTTGMIITVSSFGFKYGMPIDVDMVIDVRFLPNPYYIAELKPLCGMDVPVYKYVIESGLTQDFLTKYLDLLLFLLPNYEKEGKTHFSIAVGCTGGRHRSVALAETIAKRLNAEGYTCSINHRDINRSIKK